MKQCLLGILFLCVIGIFIFAIQEPLFAFPSLSQLQWFNASRWNGEHSTASGIEFFRLLGTGSCQLYFEFGGRIRRSNNTVGMDGQKAVCLGVGLAPPSGLCIIYSFGLSEDQSFENVMEAYGCDVYAFDPYLYRPEASSNKSKHIHYFNFALGVNNTKKSEKGNWNDNRLQLHLILNIRDIKNRLADCNSGKHPPVLGAFAPKNRLFEIGHWRWRMGDLETLFVEPNVAIGQSKANWCQTPLGFRLDGRTGAAYSTSRNERLCPIFFSAKFVVPESVWDGLVQCQLLPTSKQRVEWKVNQLGRLFQPSATSAHYCIAQHNGAARSWEYTERQLHRMSRSFKFLFITLLALVFLSPFAAYLYRHHGKRTPSITWQEMFPYFTSVADPTACQIYHEFGGVLNRQPSIVFLDGQKAVCLDPVVVPEPDNCLVYSFGNNAEWSFDEQIESYGCEVYAFDPSVGWAQFFHLKLDLLINTRTIKKGTGTISIPTRLGSIESELETKMMSGMTFINGISWLCRQFVGCSIIPIGSSTTSKWTLKEANGQCWRVGWGTAICLVSSNCPLKSIWTSRKALSQNTSWSSAWKVLPADSFDFLRGRILGRDTITWKSTTSPTPVATNWPGTTPHFISNRILIESQHLMTLIISVHALNLCQPQSPVVHDQNNKWGCLNLLNIKHIPSD